MTAIFISHSSANNAAAEDMVAWLASKGHTSLFLDFDPEAGIVGGGNWEQTLYQKVRQCQAMIALLTPNWLASKWCFAELAQARASGKAIFPVKLQACDTLGVFGDLQQIDLVARSEEGYRQLEIGLKNAGLDPLNILLRLLRDLTLAAKQPEATVLLTIDQTEELFGYTPPEAAERFLRLLRAALEMADQRHIVLATLRSDFLGEFQAHPVLQDGVGANPRHFAYQVLPLDRMPVRNFPRIFAGPARLSGLQLEDGLVEAMVRDTATRDALPLLAFTLRRLYERHSGHGNLTIAEYDAIGGVEGAIRAEAEQVLA